MLLVFFLVSVIQGTDGSILEVGNIGALFTSTPVKQNDAKRKLNTHLYENNETANLTYNCFFFCVFCYGPIRLVAL